MFKMGLDALVLDDLLIRPNHDRIGGEHIVRSNRDHRGT
jgi:hypothetical protein